MHKLLTNLIMSGLLVGLATMSVFISTQEVGALTEKQKQQCFDNWNSVTIVYNSSRDDQFKASACKKEAACKIDDPEIASPGGGGVRYRVTCTNPNPPTTGHNAPNANPWDAPDQSECDGENGSKCCNGVKTSFQFGCKTSGDPIKSNPVVAVFLAIINFLAIGVGVAVVGGIVYGGIRYITANGNSGQTQEAIKIIVNAGVALIIFGLMYAIINFVVPGGMFN